MKRIFFYSAIILLLLSPAPLLAQEGRGKGRLVGEIKDDQGVPIAAASVTLRALKYEFELQAVSDEKGKWSLFGFAGGEYDLIIEKEGYTPLTWRQQLSGLTANPVQNLVLQKAPEVVVDPKAVPEEHLKWIKDAEALQKAGNYAEAADIYRQFLAAHPVHYRYQVNLGNCLLELKEYPSAIAAFESALAGLKIEKQGNLAGDQLAADLYSSIGTSWTALKDLPKAAESYKLSAQIAPPSDAALAYNLAEILMAGNDAAAAVEYYRLAIQINPKDPLYHEKLGYACLNLNDIPRALESFKQFVQMAPDHPRAPEIRNLIQVFEKK